MREIRGADIAMIFQNPMNALNPVWPIGDQVSEGLRVHNGSGQRAARDRAIELLKQVGIPSPELRVDEYPHQWSGGMVQRAVIAMAMANQPKLILADEPTTALDVTIQDQILALLMDLQQRRRHVAGAGLARHGGGGGNLRPGRRHVCRSHRRAGATRGRSSATPRHPYTLGLMRSIPRIDGKGDRLEPIPGAAAQSVDAAARLPLRATLPLCRAGMPRHRGRVARDRTRPFQRLPLSRAGRREHVMIGAAQRRSAVGPGSRRRVSAPALRHRHHRAATRRQGARGRRR